MVRSRSGAGSVESAPGEPTRVEGARGSPDVRVQRIGAPAKPGLLADDRDEDESLNVEDSASAQFKAASEPIPPGERSFGRYTLLRRLAYGGMGEIFLARQGGAGSLAPVAKLVVIKRILSHMKRDEKHRRMFLDEARLQALFNSPHIVQIHDMGEEGGHVFLAMEHVHGPSWRALVERCRQKREHIPIAHVCAMIAQAARGLAYAHNLVDVTGAPLKIVHRDINPHNVLVTYDGEVKIIDFGIAKSELADGNTETGTIKGKFSYMSPEQSAAQVLDRRSDIFALGICLYELLALENPFRRGNVVLSLEAIQRLDPPPVSRKRRDAAPLQGIVDRCLAKERNDRFDDASEIAHALESMLDGGVIPAASTPLGPWLRERFADEIAEHLTILEQTGSTNAVVARGGDPSSLPRRRPVTSKPSGRPVPVSEEGFPMDVTALEGGDDLPAAGLADAVTHSRALTNAGPYDNMTSSTPAPFATADFDIGAMADDELEPEPGPRRSRLPLLLAAAAIAAGLGAGVAWVADPKGARSGVERVLAALTGAPTVVAEAPKDPPKVDPTAVDPPKDPKDPKDPVVDTPKEDPPKVDPPKADPPKSDPAKTDQKKVVVEKTKVRPAPERPVPVDKAAVALVAVTSDGYAVKGGRKLFAGETTTLSIDARDGAPYSVKVRLRVDDKGAARMDVETDPWALLFVDASSKGKTPTQKSVPLPADRAATIELSSPAAGKMRFTLKVSALPH